MLDWSTSAVNSLGRHVIAELWGVEEIRDEARIEAILVRAVEACGAIPVGLHVYLFEPQGMTAFAVLKESHIALHAWPEYDYLGADIFICGDGDPQKGLDIISEMFNARHRRMQQVSRGEGYSNFG